MNSRQDFRKFELIDPTSVKPGKADHEFLSGGQGKAINYRQQRYRVQDLLHKFHDLNPRVICELFEGELVDFAVTGASCLSKTAVEAESGQVVERIWIMFGDESFYKGSARIVHVTASVPEATGGEQVVGLQLLEGVMDIERVERMKAEAEIAEEMRKSRVILAREDVSEAYKRSVADFLFVVQKYRYMVGRRENDLQQVAFDSRPAMELEFLETAWENFRLTIEPVEQRLEELTRYNYTDREFQEVHRAYTLPIVTPHVVQAPVLYNSWAKPLGYAGDHVVMSHIYDRTWAGGNMFAKLMHKYGIEHPMSQAVRSRRDFLLENIKRVVGAFASKRASGETCRIVSLGSGPAREVADFARDYRGPAPVQVTLVDQDNSALGFANRQISPLVVKADSRITMQYLYLAFAQLLRNQELFQSVPEADLLFCSGLFDYLSAGKARMLTNWLMSKVRPGGQLIIGNFASPPGAAWTPSYLLDWNLRYRTQAEMEELVQEVADRSVWGEVRKEATGLCYFAVIEKKSNG